MNKEKLLKYLKEGFITLIVVAIFANVISYIRKPDIDASKIPQFSALTINNTIFDSTNIDKPTLIHFWATWCPTCKLESSNIQTLSKHFNVLTIAVKSGSNSEIKEYMDKHSCNYKVLNDSDAKIAQQFKVAAFPTTFIYNSEGSLEFSEVGYTSTLGLYLRMVIAE